MGNSKRPNKKQKDIDAAAVGVSSGMDIADDFRRAMNDAVTMSNTSAIFDPKSANEDAVWLPGTLLSFADFCASADHMNFPPLSPRQKMVAEYMFGDEPKKMFDNNRNTAILVYGKGSGKDTLAALMQLYITYVLLNLKNPQRFLRQPNNVNIDLMNIASTKEQAQMVYFQIVKTLVLNWKWLRSKWDIVINGRFFSSGQTDDIDYMNKVTVTGDTIIFPNNIRAFSGSAEAESLEGRNVLWFALDEVDAFKTGSQLRSAAKIYRTLRTSAVSRFGTRFKGMMLSFPRSSGGFIMTMYKQSLSHLNIYGDIAATWEVKPRELFSKETFEFEGKDIPMDFYEDFRLDPVGSKSAYLCDSPRVESLFLDEPERVDLATSGFVRPLFDFKDASNDMYVSKKVARAPFMHNRSLQHILVLDLGLTKNSTALTLMHRDADRIVVDFCTSWIPDPKHGIVVDLLNVEEVINTIKNSVTVSALYTDRWNCLSGDTVVPLIDGRKMTMAELAEKHPDGGFWVYSIDGDRIVAAKASAAKKTAVGAPMLAVTIDNGERVMSTPEHKFMMRDGSYREAKDLRAGDSLMPLYSRVSEYKRDGLAGYEKVYHPYGRWQFTHQAVAQSLGLTFGKGFSIHHRDFSKLNNHPDNLQVMTSTEHLIYHRSLRARIEPQRLAAWKKWWANPANRAKRKARMQVVMAEKWKDPEMAKRFMIGQKKAIIASAKSESAKISRAAAFRRNVVDAGKKHSANKFTDEVKLRIGAAHKIKWADPAYREKMRNTPGRAEYKNHKVVSVEPCGSHDAYDIEVPGTQNFAIGQGIFVHNSAMLCQKLRGQGVKAETVKLEYDDFVLFKRLLYAGNIQLPKNERLLNELKSLQQVTPSRIGGGEKKDGSHNDMAITLVMGVKMLAKSTTADGGLGLLAEGEFVGDNLSGTADEFSEHVEEKGPGVQIDGISI